MSVLSQAQVSNVATAEITEDPDWGIGTFTCADYDSKTNAEYSEPILVEGRAWRLLFYPKGYDG